MHTNTATHLLSQSAYWRLSKVLVEKLGLHKAFILTNIIDKSEYFISTNMTDDGWFYYRIKDMKKDCPIADKTLRDIIDEFIELGFIEKQLRQQGMDRLNFFKVNAITIEKYISECLIEKLNNKS